MMIMEYAFVGFGVLLATFFAYGLVAAPFVELFRKKQPIEMTRRQHAFHNRLVVATLVVAALSLAAWWLGRDYWW